MDHPTKIRIQIVVAILLTKDIQPTRVATPATSQRPPATTRLLGSVVDSDTKEPLAARVYVQDQAGNWLFVRSASEQGTAWPYAEQWVPMPQSVERHTTVSADPFSIDLPPGEYQIQLERGKEYLPLREKVTIPAANDQQRPRQVLTKEFALKRRSNDTRPGLAIVLRRPRLANGVGTHRGNPMVGKDSRIEVKKNGNRSPTRTQPRKKDSWGSRGPRSGDLVCPPITRMSANKNPRQAASVFGLTAAVSRFGASHGSR